MTVTLPRFVIAKPLASGATGFYFNVPLYYRRQGCPVPNEPLGTDYTRACGERGDGGRAATLNGLFDEWRAAKAGEPLARLEKFGTVGWLFREFKRSEAYRERVSARTAPDYDRIMKLVDDLPTKRGDMIGARRIKAISPRAADKIYAKLCSGPRGPRLRQGEKVIAVCRRAWRVVHRLYPDLFDREIPNPWQGVTKRRRTLKTKAAATRDQVYSFAWGAVQLGQPEAAAAAVICFEWLQRPENVLAGFIRWPDYRGKDAPDMIRVEHHKTGAMVLHPLEEKTKGGAVRFYAEAEEILASLPRRGVSMILRPVAGGPAMPFKPAAMAQRVRRIADKLGISETFTLDACRHGGMTELEEAELTEGQGRALSAHRSKAYEGYAKRTRDRALAATRKRHAFKLAHRIANNGGTDIQNDARFGIQNDVAQEG